MNRFEQAFSALKKNNKKAFVPYIMAGDGGLDCLVDRLIILERNGATAIEVGVPFSDPVADGPTIQRAGIRALENGTTLKGIIAEIRKARQEVSVPILLMTYLNPIYSYGINEFVKDIRLAGVDGCIIPDLPIEEEEIITPQLEEAEIELIRLVTLTTPMERIKTISSKGKGFLYTVTIKGITGARNEYDSELNQFLLAIKEVSPIPVLAGFGISSQDQILDLTKYCDGVIVGSKIVDLFNSQNLLELEKLMSVFKSKSEIV
ncbi:tryptophan synthase subunit alpha [Neobacillus sp. OS1-33]|jgi:tryptophan synthase alpha chain|uniref:tryptophan synthase subunit alpha n=1 Tax=Neobacillus sp. OS1-33 TaxID=3070683 RepID=UPI0027E10E69|nr:tryptophan synthase subunit alpha [Neobacillus sp. OS1-33]WML25968.1 tryptophan synthase subunit alpha [Neobacillus sp. OS1-33]